MAEMPVDPIPIPGSGCRFMHVVRYEDYWFYITRRYGVSVEDIMEANGLQDDQLDTPATVLCIP